jgi:hypothetical protein
LGDGIGRLLGRHVHARHRQPRALRELAGDPIELVLRSDLPRPHRSQGDLVAEEVRDEVHDARHHQRDRQALRAADELPAEQDQPGQKTEENRRFQVVVELAHHTRS